MNTDDLCRIAHEMSSRERHRLDRLDLGSVETMLIDRARERTEHQADFLAHDRVDSASRAAADVMDCIIALRLVRGALRRLAVAA